MINPNDLKAKKRPATSDVDSDKPLVFCQPILNKRNPCQTGISIPTSKDLTFVVYNPYVKSQRLIQLRVKAQPAQASGIHISLWNGNSWDLTECEYFCYNDPLNQPVCDFFVTELIPHLGVRAFKLIQGKPLSAEQSPS